MVAPFLIKARRTEFSIIPDDTLLKSLLQGATSSTTQAMDKSASPVHEQPDLEDTFRARKQLRMHVITYSEMHEDLEPDLSQGAFGEEAIALLETYDIEIDDDVDWDEQDYEPLTDPNKKKNHI